MPTTRSPTNADLTGGDSSDAGLNHYEDREVGLPSASIKHCENTCSS